MSEHHQDLMKRESKEENMELLFLSFFDNFFSLPWSVQKISFKKQIKNSQIQQLRSVKGETRHCQSWKCVHITLDRIKI